LRGCVVVKEAWIACRAMTAFAVCEAVALFG
jgi:hypothetical protein